ncbi:MAG TPA: LPS export ABC transporter permease LptG [Moraxellaceae bacterium]|nr:LPS export ABC transporter permease LptG [Moraxellaceae bacterium]
MIVLSRYVSRTVISAMLLVLFLLLGLDMVFSFIAELEDLSATYRVPQALLYILLTAPRRAYDMLPIAALVGGMAGLGMLATHSELTVMRGAGVSIRRIVWWVLKPSLVLVVAGLLLSQYVVPHSEKMAESRRAIAQGKQVSDNSFRYYWHREGTEIMRVGTVETAGTLRDLAFFRFDAAGQLQSGLKVREAHFDGNGWELRDLVETKLESDGSSTVVHYEREPWSSRLSPDYLRMVTLNPEYLSLTSLYEYAGYLKQQGLGADVYFLEFWKKALAPLATISMVLIACSFIFGPLRSVTMGLRILTGVLAGLLFRYGQDFLGYASLVYDFSPLLAAGLPIGLSLLLGGVAIIRVK